MMRLVSWGLLISSLVIQLGCASTELRQGETAGTSMAEVTQQVLVTLHDADPDELKRTAVKLAKSYQLQQIAAWPITALGIHCFVYEIPASRSAEHVVNTLANDPRIETAQPMQLFEVMAYNDPYLHLQRNIQSGQIESIHRWSTGKGVRIAVVDSGVDVSHPDLQGRITMAKNFVGTNNNGETESGDVHGTAVAGVIAARPNNHVGIVGVAPDAEILALKACWPKVPKSGKALCNSFTLARAINVAISKKAHIINLSLAGPSDPLLDRLAKNAVERNITVVGAHHPVNAEARFPAKVPGVIAVRAMNSSTTRSTRNPVQSERDELAAPGDEILTTVPKGGYDFMSGSSLATASVSGFIALLMERQPSLSPSQLKTLLMTTARSSAPNGGMRYPTNVIDPCRALSQVTAVETCP